MSNDNPDPVSPAESLAIKIKRAEAQVAEREDLRPAETGTAAPAPPKAHNEQTAPKGDK